MTDDKNERGEPKKQLTCGTKRKRSKTGGSGPVDAPVQVSQTSWAADDHKDVDWAEILQPMSGMSIAEEKVVHETKEESNWEYSTNYSSLSSATELGLTHDEAQPLVTATEAEIIEVLTKARVMVPDLGRDDRSRKDPVSHQISGMSFHRYYLNPETNPQLRGVAAELFRPDEQHEGRRAAELIAPLYGRRIYQRRDTEKKEK